MNVLSLSCVFTFFFLFLSFVCLFLHRSASFCFIVLLHFSIVLLHFSIVLLHPHISYFISHTYAS